SQLNDDDDEEYTNGSVSPTEPPPLAGKGRGKKVAPFSFLVVTHSYLPSVGGSGGTVSYRSSNRGTVSNAQETPRFSNRAGSARSRQSYATRPPATQQNGQASNGQAEVAEVAKKPGIPVP
ncbi:hypothetical protein MAR_036691, partial [Mya arenaria]